MTQTKPAPTFKNIKKLHLLLCFILTAVILGFYYITISAGSQMGKEDPAGLIYEFVVPIIAVASILVGNFLAKKTIKKVASGDSFDHKMHAIQASSVQLWSVVVGSSIFATIGFFMTGRTNLILYALMLGVLLIYLRPIKSKIVKDFKLSEDEAQELGEAL